MKIGIVTFYKDNYGSMLQCYATCKAIEKLGYEPVLLGEKKEEISKISRLFHKMWKALKSVVCNPTYIKDWKLTRQGVRPLSFDALTYMNQEAIKLLHPDERTWEDLCIMGKSEEFVGFITGSDQVWNCYNEILPSYFLKFTLPSKRMTFSVSLGVGEANPFFCKLLKKNIHGFERISVREDSGKEILRDITDAEILRLCDPVILLEKEEWNAFADEEIVEKPYVVHFLNEPSDKVIQVIQDIVNCDKGQVICLSYYYDKMQKHGWKQLICSPKQYVSYIRDAKMVFTDSFHTTEFSIMWEKKFWVFERNYLHLHNQETRILELLTRYGMINRYISEGGDMPSKIGEVSDVAKLLDKEREVAIQYLKEEIEKRMIISE